VAEAPQLIKFSEDAPITIGAIHNSSMLDGRVVTAFGQQALAFVSTRKSLNLLFDFAGVEYLSSAALTELIKVNDAVVAGGGSMRICGLTPQIQKVFEITRFDKSFDIHAGERAPQAVARFKRSIALAKEQEAWEKRPGS
jgi:anti-sigma B factor antagonist